MTGLALIRESAMRLTAMRVGGGVDPGHRRGRRSVVVVGRSPLRHQGPVAGGRRCPGDRGLAQLLEQLGDADVHDGEFMSIAAAFHDQVGSDGAPAYLRRLLIDGGPAATELFGTLYAATVASLADLESAGVLRPTADVLARAAFLLINDLAVVLLRDEVARVWVSIR